MHILNPSPLSSPFPVFSLLFVPFVAHCHPSRSLPSCFLHPPTMYQSQLIIILSVLLRSPSFYSVFTILFLSTFLVPFPSSYFSSLCTFIFSLRFPSSSSFPPPHLSHPRISYLSFPANLHSSVMPPLSFIVLVPLPFSV